MRRIFLNIAKLLAILFAIALVWGGWYVNRRGFTRNWRQYVNSEFEKRGLSVSIHRITLDPFHGLVARDVEIVDVKNNRRTLAIISQVALDINYSNLLHREPFLNGVDLRNTKLILPIDPSNPFSPRIQISKLNAHVLLPPRQFYLSQADAVIYGIHVSASGRLINPEALHLGSGADSSGSAANGSSGSTGSDFISGLIERIRALQFESSPPQLEILFGGDGREPGKIFADATLWGEKIRNQGYRIENIFTVLSYRDGALNIKKCVVSDGHGFLDLSGTWQRAGGRADFQARSTLDLQAFSHAYRLVPELDEFIFYDPPTIELSGEYNPRKADSPGGGMLIGRVALKKFGLRSVLFDAFNASFSWDGTRWYARDVQLVHRSGELTGSAVQLPGDFRASLQSNLNPRILLPLFTGETARNLAEWDFTDNPQVSLTAAGTAPEFGKCDVTGQLRLGRTVFRGSQMDSGKCNLLIREKTVTYDQFEIRRGEGIGTGSFGYDFAKHEVHLDKIKSTLVPQDAAPWVNPDLVKNIAPYRFKTRPNLSIDGLVQFAGGKQTNLEILVDAPGGMDYTFLKKNLSFSSISGRLLFTDNHLQLSNISGSLFSGSIRGGAEISLARNAPGHSATITAENIDFESLTKLYFNYENSRGLLNGTYAFTGRGDDPRAMQGRGQLTITNGNVFAIPFFGPLTGILNAIVPGMGYDVARKASGNFKIADGVIENHDLTITGRGFNMIGGGRIYFVDDRMDFGVRINAQGIPGVLLFAVSKLFEYSAEGSLSKPVWKPKRIPSL